MALRWVPFSRVSMQRAGALVAVTAVSSDSRPTDLVGITRAYSQMLRRTVDVPLGHEEALLEYVRELRLWKRYGSLRQTDSPPLGWRPELQDVWLADPRLPSATGAITDEVEDELPQLAASLRLVRPKNYTQTDRARALMALLSNEQRAVLRPDGRSVYGGDENLFCLTLGTKAFLSYILLDADIDFVRVAHEVANLDAQGEFTRADFADQLNQACRLLKKRFERKARTGIERRLLMRLEEWATEIDKVKGGRPHGKKWGGGRPPDQLATLRLEPYVDFGLIGKRSRSKYRYALTTAQAAFFSTLRQTEESQKFLEHEFFGSFVQAIGLAPRLVSDEQVWTRIVSAYYELRSPLGFASFREVVLLAISRLIDEETGDFFEVAHGIEVLRAQHRAAPRGVRFGVTRGGGLTYMKLVGGGADGCL